MQLNHSKRAKILAEALRYIDADDWESRDGFLIFGKEQFQMTCGELIDKAEVQSNPSLATKVKKNRGERMVAARTTLGPLPEDRSIEHVLDWMLSLPKEVRDAVTAGLASHPEEFAGPITDEAEAMDSYLAWEALETLDIAFARVETLDDVEIQSRSFLDQGYFEEAHRCEMAGFNIATSILCGAMLESALKEKVDPRKSIENKVNAENRRRAKTGEKRISYVEMMIDEAAKSCLLDDRPGWAKKVHLARNAAVHDLRKFEKNYSGAMRDIVDNWRKVLIDLYAQEANKSLA